MAAAENWEKNNKSTFAVSIMAANGLAPLSVPNTISCQDIMMEMFGIQIHMGIELNGLTCLIFSFLNQQFQNDTKSKEIK